MRKCEIVFQTDDYHSTGFITLDGTKLGMEPAKGYEPVLREVLSDHNVALGGKIVYPDKDPVAWFEALPYQYHGTYMWARMVA